MSTTQTHRYGCPKCGGERIEEVSEVLTRHLVIAWSADGEPLDYDSAEVCWDTCEAVEGDPYQCADCWHTFAEPKRIEEPESADDATDDDLRAGPHSADEERAFMNWLISERADRFGDLMAEFRRQQN